MTLPQHFKKLAESQNYIVGHIFESGYIINKRNGKQSHIGDSYGDPTFGLIDRKENWALLLGHGSYLWTADKIKNVSTEFFASEKLFENPFDAKQINDIEVEILEDPWSDNPCIFNLNIQTNVIKKVRTFKKLDIPYEDSDKLKLSW